MLEGQLGTVSTELKQLRADQKAQKREIRKVAAAAANEEIRAQTERFEAKLRAKDAKVKDARKKAKAVRIVAGPEYARSSVACLLLGQPCAVGHHTSSLLIVLVDLFLRGRRFGKRQRPSEFARPKFSRFR